MFAARTEVEQRAWMAASGEGCWRFERTDAQDGDGKWITRRRVQGLRVEECLARMPPSDDAEREAMVEALTAIEAGAVDGSWRGWAAIVMPETGEGEHG